MNPPKTVYRFGCVCLVVTRGVIPPSRWPGAISSRKRTGDLSAKGWHMVHGKMTKASNEEHTPSPDFVGNSILQKFSSSSAGRSVVKGHPCQL